MNSLMHDKKLWGYPGNKQARIRLMTGSRIVLSCPLRWFDANVDEWRTRFEITTFGSFPGGVVWFYAQRLEAVANNATKKHNASLEDMIRNLTV